MGYGQDGVKVKSEDVRFPFVLHFQPNEDLTKFCEERSSNLKDDVAHFPCLEDLEVGQTLYKVYAIYEPRAHDKLKEGDVIHVGDIINTSQFVKSKFGDNKLHFTHMTFEQNMENMTDYQRKQFWTDRITDEYMNK